MNRITFLATLLGAFFAQPIFQSAKADLFGSGENSFDIEFVTIGNPFNPADTTDQPVTYGAVPYEYRIGKYEISEQMVNKANALGGLALTIDSRGPDKPATSVTWFEAAKFVNWLNTSTGSVPAYKFDDMGNFQLWQPGDLGYDAANLYRNSLAKFFLPSLNEWHKAAYYDPAAGTYYDYPTGSDTVPDGVDFPGDPFFDAVFFDGGSIGGPNDITDVGIFSRYGTAAQGGNVIEWEETAIDGINNDMTESRGDRGGSWSFGASVMAASNRNGISPFFEGEVFGFRVASIVPEPTSVLLALIAILCLGSRRISRA